MRVRIFTLMFDRVLRKFHDDELQEFLNGKELLGFRDHFFAYEEHPCLALILKYLPAQADVKAPKPREQGSTAAEKKTNEWRKILDETDVNLFNQLREWRSEQAQKEGVPPYIVFNNEQLAHIAKNKPRSLAELARIPGIGKAKVSKYGKPLFKILHGESFVATDADGEKK